MCRLIICNVVFFKQKTAYVLRISDWSSDVCSSDLRHRPRCHVVRVPSPGPRPVDIAPTACNRALCSRTHETAGIQERSSPCAYPRSSAPQIGSASCRERVCQSVYISVVDVLLTRHQESTQLTPVLPNTKY